MLHYAGEVSEMNKKARKFFYLPEFLQDIINIRSNHCQPLTPTAEETKLSYVMAIVQYPLLCCSLFDFSERLISI
jgi:hypothetical protein